jgi:hypothetical protein
MTGDRGRLFDDDEEVEELVNRFESCELVPTEFRHRQHLAVALFYLLRLSDADALERVRRGLFKLIQAHGIDPALYNETLTVFWLRRVRAFIGRGREGRRLAELADALAEECGDSRLVYQYFSKTLVDSAEAKKGWVEPDLKPLDF